MQTLTKELNEKSLAKDIIETKTQNIINIGTDISNSFGSALASAWRPPNNQQMLNEKIILKQYKIYLIQKAEIQDLDHTF
jgi:hypothetical protein